MENFPSAESLPRIPFPSKKGLLNEMASHGRKLADCHILKSEHITLKDTRINEAIEGFKIANPYYDGKNRLFFDKKMDARGTTSL